MVNLRFILVVVSVLLCFAQNSFAFKYQITNLGDFGGDYTRANRLNNNRQIVGTSNLSNGESRAFIWDSGVMSEIDLGSDYDYFYITDISDSGWICGGRFITSLGIERSYVYKDAPPPIDIPGISSATAWTWSYGINNNNVSVGYEIIQGFGRVGTIIENDQVTHIPNLLGGTRTEAKAINDSGIVTGYTYGAADSYSTYHAFYYDGSTMKDIGTFGGNRSYGADVNNKNQVIGFADTLTGRRAFVYEDNSLIDLGVLGTGESSAAYAINESSQIVGNSYFDSAINEEHAFLYQEGIMYDLNDMLETQIDGLILVNAVDINDQGDILAIGVFNDNYDNIQSFLLTAVTPIPEPLTALMIVSGLTGLFIKRQK